MNILREAVDILLSGHTAAQKLNYLKFITSKRLEEAAYDPVTISIVATTSCTLSCDMCPTHSARVPRDYSHIQKNVKDIDIRMFREIIDRFRNATTVHIIGSGEPLLNKDFFKMVDYAAERKMAVKTFSNGTVIRENIDNILSSRLDGITISINGHDAKEFRRMTGMDEAVYSGIYDATERLISEKAKRRSPVKVKLSFIIDKYNYRSIPAMVETTIKLGADHAFFCSFLPSPYSGLSHDERVLTAGEGVKDELNAIFGGYPPFIRKILTPPALVDAKMRKNLCEAHFSQIRFDGDGNVSSCSMMLLDMRGHGRYDDEGVWNNDFFRKMRRAFLSGDGPALPEACRVCPDNKGVVI